MSTERPNPLANLEIFRLENLEDGVFAIAMTLLVLNLKIPARLDDSLIKGILQIWPSLVTFFGSFLLLGVFWFGHRAALDYIKHADHIFHWLNILLLMFVSIVPFSASLMAKYYYEQTAIIIYGLNLILIGITMYIQWVYATINYKLIDNETPVFVIKYAKLRIIFPPISYSLAILLSFINLRISLIIYTIVPALYILPFLQPFWRRFVKG